MKKLFKILSTFLGMFCVFIALFGANNLIESIGLIIFSLPFFSFFRDGIAQNNISRGKRVCTYILLTVFAFFVIGMSQSEHDVETSTNDSNIVEKEEKDIQEQKNDNSETDVVIDMNKYKDSIILDYLKSSWNFANTKNIKIPYFKERDKIFKLLTYENQSDILSQTIYVNLEEQQKFFSSKKNNYYKKSLYETQYLYYGELNDDAEPDGIGIIFQLYDGNADEILTLIKYAGYFDAGKYDGYGIDFQIYDSDDIPNVVSREILLKNPVLFNTNELYEGYFENGEYSGDGLKCVSNLYENAIVYSSNDIIDPNDLLYSYNIGEYSENMRNGKILEYLGGKLIYEGEEEDNQYDGYGKLYYESTGKIKYKGEFDGGKYHGKGVLYDENGKIIHEGEFSAGDIK